ncbi:Serine/threonine-protein kinase PrkC [Gimesia maris]|uniref:protein kinase domain-containing protein n=1 Tax=Gimesia maris TaxID=122 RepID=UPI00118B8D38|nr:protein kinase [Gimesia maris]QDU14547.1 Serine/threonine-protein kinase PrkC [Gimesia maris]
MSENLGTTQKQLVTFLRKRDYILVSELGRGACGQTVLLHDDLINEYFICKKYCPQTESRRKEYFDNFVREIKLLHQLHHPNVVRVFNYYLYPDQFAGYILMEYIDGFEIDKYVAENPEKINDVFRQTLSGFEHLEQAKILHRDVRLRNLMVTSEGVVKVIDLGFGKQIENSEDFNKSVSLNWWCETPDEFNSSQYDFSTDVYFVGKLFEKLIRDNNISHFNYSEALRKMCSTSTFMRTQSFGAVLQEIRNDQFDEIEFSDSDIQIYRNFANELSAHIPKIENGAKYIDDLSKIERRLYNAYQNFMLERYVPDCSVVINCFIDGVYYLKRTGFSVSAVKEFLSLIQSCTNERGQLILANLHTRLDSIARYDNTWDADDVPF